MWNSIFVISWRNFFVALFRPGPMLLFVVAIIFGHYSVVYQSDKTIATLLAIIAAFASAVGGTLFQNVYKQPGEVSALEKKGRSAYRNLLGISRQINNLELWATEVIKKNKSSLLKNILQELVRHLNNLDLSARDGIEDWVDVVPELKKLLEEAMKDREGKVRTIKTIEKVESIYYSKLLDLKKQVAGLTKEKATDRADLLKEISNVKKELNELRSEKKGLVGFNNSGTAVNLNTSSDYDLMWANTSAFANIDNSILSSGYINPVSTIALADTIASVDSDHSFLSSKYLNPTSTTTLSDYHISSSSATKKRK